MRVVDDASRKAALIEGADVLRRGGLVAFPTETVYGLGANALDAAAVQRIYDAKGRPALNPIIVHVANVHAARALAGEWTSAADRIAQSFWPGPVTLVVKKRDVIPDIVTAGGDTVGLRVPAHPIALALLEHAGVPVAAPSANLSTQVSPTTAEHVERGLGDRIDLIIDGGPTTVGIESTVVDVTGAVPRILRPGMIARADIARVTGATGVEPAPLAIDESPPRSPGMMAKHYSPRAPVYVLERREIDRRIGRESGRVGALTFEAADADAVEVMPLDPAGYARRLYAALHALDDARCDVILVERPPESSEWAAIRDRLARAASQSG